VTSPMPDYLRELLEKYSDQIILPERPTFDEHAARVRQQLETEHRLAVRVWRPERLVITDVS